MFTKTLSENAAGVLALLGKSGILKEAYLAGGTACALQLGHRISLDLDFFTEKEFPTDIVLQKLEQLPTFKPDETSKWTILGGFPQVKFSMRFFIALEIPSGNLAQFQAIQHSLHTLIPQSKLTDVDKIHLTLAFLGEQNPAIKDKFVNLQHEKNVSYLK